MPIYTYECESCRFKEEQVRCIADRDTAMSCPDCKKGILVRGLDAPVLKIPDPAAGPGRRPRGT
jgi:putative FmdB family regulatory protein